jgi:hypothetical protein
MALYGFHNIQDIAAARVSGTNQEAVNDAINASVAEHNRQITALMGLFVDRTTLYTERYAQVGNTRLQPLDNSGRALPVKPSGFYNVAYPIQSGGSAWGADYVTRAKMTVGDAERATALMLSADARWMRDHILAALFASATYDFTDPLYGTLTVQPLANGDSVTYGVATGGDTSATDTHQLAQANAIGAGTDNPFPAIKTELMEHPENGGDVIVFIPTGLTTTVKALATFNPVADPNITSGANSDRLTGALGVSTPGTLIGYEDAGVWIVEWPSMPANYMVGVTTQGPRPLAMREDPEPELQGFNRVASRDDHPFYESQWLRRAGFGARNRVGAVVQRIGNGTYAVPTGYTTPMG